MSFKFPHVKVGAWDPFTYGPTLGCIAPEFDDGSPGGSGLWHARAGNDLTSNADTGYLDGAPVFDGSSSVIVSSDTVGDLISATAYHLVVVADFTSIATTTGTVYTNASLLAEGNGGWGLSVYKSSSQFFAQLFDYDSAQRVATVEITALVDGSGAGTVVLQAKKEGGTLYIKANDGNWVTGNACGSTTGGSLAATLRVGSSYGGASVIDGAIRGVLIFDAAQSDAFADEIPAWAATVPSGWTRRSLGDMPSSPDFWYWRDGAQCAKLESGRILLIGGWNNSTAPWSATTNSSNEVWASDDDGETWELLLAYDDSPPSYPNSGCRFKAGHCVGVTTWDGKAVVLSDDLQNQEVWISNEDGDEWTLLADDAPCDVGNPIVGKIGDDIYLMGGATGTLGSVTAHQEVYKSTDGGETWSQLSNAPWDGRSAVWRAVEHKGKLYVVCGGILDTVTTVYNGVWSFDGTTWDEVLADGHGQFDEALHVGVASTGDRLWLFNGNTGSSDLRRCMYSEDDGATWLPFYGGSGGPDSHADNVITISPTKILRWSGYPSERKIHLFEKL